MRESDEKAGRSSDVARTGWRFVNMMRLFALALLIACGGAAAQDCDPRPFPLTLPKADARMEKEGRNIRQKSRVSKMA